MDTPHIPAFMPGGAGMISKMTEEEETQQNFKISKAINAMDAELKDRFKALKSIYDINREFEEEEQKEIRQLEVAKKNLDAEMKKLNTLFYKNTDMQEKLKNDNFNIENEFK